MSAQFSRHPTALAPAETIDIDIGSVHVWSLSIWSLLGQVPALEPLLSPAERARASRLRIDIARDAFVVRRGVLRVLLGQYLGRAPEELEFQYGPYGKPEFSPSCGDGSLTFNLSVSHGLVLYAVARDRELGVDVERVRDGLPHAGLANRYFSIGEREELRRLPSAAVIDGFFNGWTRKEAYVKAIGTGLVTRLDSFTVTLTPGAPARLQAPPRMDGGRPWTLTSLDTIPGYAAALVTAGDCDRIVHRPWPPHGGL